MVRATREMEIGKMILGKMILGQSEKNERNEASQPYDNTVCAVFTFKKPQYAHWKYSPLSCV